MPTLLLPHATRDEAALAAARPPRRAAASPARTCAASWGWWAVALSRWRATLEIALGALATAFVLGRVPLPDPLNVGYRSCARIVALLFLGGALAGAPGVAVARSRIATALLGLCAAATASVAAAGGRTAAVNALWSALGVFLAVRTVAADDRGRRRLLHGLGLVCVGVLARELWHEPMLLAFHEQHRNALATEHPNTLGFALALLLPVLLAATARRILRAATCVYAAAGTIVLLATFSRAAWLALGGSVVALALATRPPGRRAGARRAQRSSSARVEAALAVGLLLALAVIVLSRDRTGGDAQRLRILGTSWSLFLEHWPLGVGFGSGNLEPLFPVRYLERNGESLFLFHSHDLYLDLLTGSGVLGALAALVLFATVARVAWRALSLTRHRAARAEAAGAATSFGVFLVLGLVDTPLYHGRLLLLSVVLWAMLDAAADCSVRSHEPKKAASLRAEAGRRPHASVRRERHRLCSTS